VEVTVVSGNGTKLGGPLFVLDVDAVFGPPTLEQPDNDKMTETATHAIMNCLYLFISNPPL